MKRTPIRRRSTRKAASDAEYAQAREQVMFRAYGRCEANTPACPLREHEAVHVHHRLPRSARVDHSLENLLACCTDAHDFIHAHPQISYENGWLLSRYS